MIPATEQDTEYEQVRLCFKMSPWFELWGLSWRESLLPTGDVCSAEVWRWAEVYL